MNYTTKSVRIGGEDKNVLIVTADRQVTREEIGDIESAVTGYCATFKRDGSVDTWFFYEDGQDALIKTWIAQRESRAQLDEVSTVVDALLLEDLMKGGLIVD